MANRGRTDGTADEIEDAFVARDSIFSDEQLLEIGYVPGSERIVGCNEEIRQLAIAINPALIGNKPNNVFLYGQTGTGKSLCAQYGTRQLQAKARDHGVSVGVSYVDCSQEDTEARAIRRIATELNDSDESGITVPETGIGRSQYYSRLWDILESRFDVGIVVLDEVDFLLESNLLLQLSRANEANKLDNCSLGVVGISNKPDYGDRMSERAKSSLQEHEIIFTPYSAEELQSILTNRTSAFKDDALADGVLAECAELAAEEHGDARRAINLLRHAGEVALEEKATTVKVEHVTTAYEAVDRDRFGEVLDGATDQQKAVLFAVVLLGLQEESGVFRTNQIYREYENVCTEVGLDVLSKRRVLDLLREWEFLQVLSINRTGDGRGKGSYLEHQLTKDLSVIRSAIQEDDRFGNLTVNPTNISTTWSNV